ncbi:MAG: 5'/3'-nucleotidase SurE [Actinomycetota bacterium]
MHTNRFTSAIDTITGTVAVDAGSDDEPLRILLTNDDGWDAPGLVMLAEALRSAGHDVTVVAPAANRSGASANVSFIGTLAVTRHDERTFAVHGTPVEAVSFGLDVVFAGDAPDLVISGANDGENVGAMVLYSGTVAAAAAALNAGVPAIAVSSEFDLETFTVDHRPTVAAVVELVTALGRRRIDGAVLPAGVGINLNHPRSSAGEDPEVEVTRTGRGWFALEYHLDELPAPGTTTEANVGFRLDVPEPLDGADTTALAAGRISVAVLHPGMDRPPVGLVGPHEAAVA